MRRLYKKALAVDPNMAMAYYKMARVYTQKGDLKKALEYIALAIEIEPDILRVFKMDDYRWDNLRRDKVYWPLAEKHNLGYLEQYKPTK